MNKKQLVIVWLIAVAICLLMFFPPRLRRYRDGKWHQIPPSGYIKSRKHYSKYYDIRIDWSNIFRYTIPILLVGALSIYTLRDKREQAK